MSNRLLGKIAVFFLGTVSAATIVLNVALVKKNRVLAAEAQVKYDEVEVPRGTLVPPIKGLDLSGKDVLVDPRAPLPTLVMVFTTSCGFCKKNWTNWQSLVETGNKRSFNAVLIDLSSKVNQAYLHEHSVDEVTTISQLDPAMLAPYRFRVVPQTILVGKDGRVRDVVTGVMTPKDVETILQATSTNLGLEESHTLGIAR
jgi:hypothetical protein